MKGRADSCHNKTRICRVPSYKQENTRFRAGVALSFRDLLLARCTVCRYPIPFGAPRPFSLGVSPAVLGSRLGRCFASRGVHWTPATRSLLLSLRLRGRHRRPATLGPAQKKLPQKAEAFFCAYTTSLTATTQVATTVPSSLDAVITQLPRSFAVIRPLELTDAILELSLVQTMVG